MTRALSSAIRNMRRSPYQALTATLMMSLTFFIAFSFAIMLYVVDTAIKFVETRPRVIAYFEVTASQGVVDAAKETMTQKPYAASVTTLTKQDALAIFKEENKKDPLLLELVTADILPASIEVSAKTIEDLPKVQQDLNSLDGVEEVVYRKDLIENLSYWTRTIRIAGLTATGVLLVVTILLVFVILSLRVAVKRKEISIMRLLGAGMWYIRGPFLFEGILYGVMGAIIGWLSCYTLLLYLTPSLLQFFGTIRIFPLPILQLLSMLGIGVLSGLVIGVVASMFAVKRFVRN